MPTISSILITATNILLSSRPSASTHPSKVSYFPSLLPPLFSKSLPCPYPQCKFLRNPKRIVSLKSSEAEEISSTEDEWLQRLPDKKKPLYSHSLPCIEAWLKDLGFYQSKEDRAIWFIEKPDWHAQVSLDVTDLFISEWSPGGEKHGAGRVRIGWMTFELLYKQTFSTIKSSKMLLALLFKSKVSATIAFLIESWLIFNRGKRMMERYLKNGPGNLEKDMERRFSYALSREDIQNAILGGP
ncbi:hypothetical protein DKX38_018350 [Salix brachista]|uniref:Uncharacterized protein n=1 Tax=Salix brachista TaxID=2182728 RepID=A0A5N5KMV4_9ROSI|nr:hypothetical protein DKX38_018350 [Salix brachista]